MEFKKHLKIFNIIGTINLSTIDKEFVRTMVKKGVTMLRLNGAFLKQETLKAIANDLKVELRYTQCAKAALEHGKGAANHQI